jgi:hypothetical protein
MNAFPVEKSNEPKEPSKSYSTYEIITIRKEIRSGNIDVLFYNRSILPTVGKPTTHLYSTSSP